MSHHLDYGGRCPPMPEGQEPFAPETEPPPTTKVEEVGPPLEKNFVTELWADKDASLEHKLKQTLLCVPTDRRKELIIFLIKELLH
jgi:hypothetical protein